MAGTAVPNWATFELNGTVVTAREGETWPLGGTPDFAGGMNRGGSNAPGVGINTGDYDPKSEDWPRIADTEARTSQHIGGVPDTDGDTGTTGFAIQATEDNADLNDNVAFVQAESETAPDAELDATTGAVNKTGQTVPAGAWAWGVIENA